MRKLLLLVVLAACIASCAAYVDGDVAARITKLMNSVGSDTSKLTAHHLDQLRYLGFSDRDIQSLNEPAVDVSRDSQGAPGALEEPRFAEKRVHKAMHRRRAQKQGGKTPLNVMVPNWPSAPAGFTATGFRFWLKAFIPGRVPDGQQLAYIEPNPICPESDNSVRGYPRDGLRDTVLFPARMGVYTSYVKGDSRAFNSAPEASHRLGVFCELFKNGNQYKAKCSKQAGWSRHWKRKGILGDGCYYVDCEQLDNFRGDVESGAFTGSLNEWAVSIGGANPCAPAVVTPAISWDAKITITVQNGQGSIKLGGSKGRFPAFEGYFRDGSGAPQTWFQFTTDGRSPLQLALPGVSVNQDPRNFQCAACR